MANTRFLPVLTAAATVLAASAARPAKADFIWNQDAHGDAGSALATASATEGIGALTTLINTTQNNDPDILLVRPTGNITVSMPASSGRFSFYLMDLEGVAIEGYNSIHNQPFSYEFIIAPEHMGRPMYIWMSGLGLMPRDLSNNAMFDINADGPTFPLSITSMGSYNGVDTNSAQTLTANLSGVVGYHNTPAPGAMALLAMAGMAASRRRR